MSQPVETRLSMAANGIRQPIGPRDADTYSRAESLARAAYDRCHPHDSFDDLKRRARFSKEDQGLLRDWMALAAEGMRREAAAPDVIPFRMAA